MPNILLTMDENEEKLDCDGSIIEKKYLLKWLLEIE
jgi:hypothetical protein